MCLRAINPAILSLLLCLEALAGYAQRPSSSQPSKDSGLTKVDSLQAAIVIAPRRPRLRGDTIEYNTGHIQLRRHSTVEELIARLPGFRIDPDGSIFYNNQKIQHLLVDGEDIFGSDPSLITKALEGSKIALVQVIDRKTDLANFTGIDDGSRAKTVNLALKESAKDGFFGKLEGGANIRSLYNGNAVLAAFRKKEQFTALGLVSNTGPVALRSDLGGDGTSLVSMTGNANGFDASAGTGIPRYSGTSLHYANTWHRSAEHLAVNFQSSQYFTQPVTYSTSIQQQPGAIYTLNRQYHSLNQKSLNWIYGVFDWLPNKYSALKLNYRFARFAGHDHFTGTEDAYSNIIPVHRGYRTLDDNFNIQSFSAELSWRTTLHKQTDHQLSMTAGLGTVTSQTKGYLFSATRLLAAQGTPPASDTVDQRKLITGKALRLIGTINYTRPVWKKALLGLSYQLVIKTDKPFQASFDRGDGKYLQPVDSLTSQLRISELGQKFTLTIRGKSGSIRYTLGNDWLLYQYTAQPVSGPVPWGLHSLTWMPRATLTRNLGLVSNISFDYQALTQQPSFAQLQPLKNNNDPLHSSIGNPHLQPGFIQTLRMDFTRSGNYLLNVFASLNASDKAISMKTNTDSFGRQVTQPANVNGGTVLTLNFSFNKELQGVDLGFSTVEEWSQSYNFLNDDLNRNNAYTTSAGFSVKKDVANHFSARIACNFSYLTQISTISNSSPIHYWTQNHSAAATLDIGSNIHVQSDLSCYWQQNLGNLPPSGVILLWNASADRDLLQNRLILKAQLTNICNHNNGLTRSSSANISTTSATNILGRYWMLSAAWHFDRKFKRRNLLIGPG